MFMDIETSITSCRALKTMSKDVIFQKGVDRKFNCISFWRDKISLLFENV